MKLKNSHISSFFFQTNSFKNKEQIVASLKGPAPTLYEILI